MKRLLLLNSQVNGILYSLIFVTAYNILILHYELFTMQIIPYITTVSFALVYRIVIYVHCNNFSQLLLLQCSLPLTKKEIVKGHYYFTYLFIIVLGVINFIPSIYLIRSNEYTKVDTIESLIMVTLLIMLSYAISAPTIFHSPSLKNTIIITLTIMIFYALCIGSGAYANVSPVPIIYINIILLVINIIAFNKSIEVCISRLSKKFD